MKSLRKKATKRRPRHPRPGKTLGAWRLFRDSLHEFVADWKRYTQILAVVAVPMDLAMQVTGVAANSLAGAYSTLASLVMNVAVLWSIVQRKKHDQAPAITHAYYDGSVALVRFILVSLVLVAMLIPFALGAALYATSLLSPLAGDLLGPEQALVGVAAFALSLPSFWMMARFGLAPIAAVYDGLRPMAALRRSRDYTLGRFWPVVGRLVMLGIFLAIVSLPATILAVLFSLFRINGGLNTLIFELATTFTALPIANLYLVDLYRNLGDTLAPAAMEVEPESGVEAPA